VPTPAAAAAIAAAKAVAARLAASLAVPGRQGASSRKELETPEAMVTINDTGARGKLTSKQVQEEINRKTGAAVTTRGRYYPPTDANRSGGDALHLHVTGETEKIVQEAVAMIKQIMSAGSAGAPPPAAARPAFFHTVQVGLDAFSHPGFGLIQRLAGEVGAPLASCYACRIYEGLSRGKF
jgi:hypothetical protein